jgi:hypothetical protein
MTTFDFRVKFTIGTGIVLTIIGTAVVGAYVKNENWRKVLEFSTTVTATVAGLTGASYAAQSLTRSAEEAKIDRTLSFISRWNDPSFEKKLVIQLLREVHDKPASEVKNFTVEKIDKDNDLKSEVNTILNFFEEMAITVNNNLVNEKTLYSFFRGIVLTHVKVFDPWIEHRRRISEGKKVFQSLTELHEHWQNGNGNGNGNGK